jgi:diguanylate cyclase (GGDEF)-like protein/putative nucleotidyltransferase with HDIG domain
VSSGSPHPRALEAVRRPSAIAALYTAMLDRMPERGVKWRSLGVLFLAGGILTLLSLTLPLSDAAWLPGVAALGISAAAAGTGMLAFGPRLPERLMSPSLAFGTVLITLGDITNRDSTSVYALFYVWVGFEAYFFLDRRQAIAHIAFIATAYAFALHHAGGPADDEEARWLLTMGTVITAGLLAGALNDRAARLIDRLADAARTDPLTQLLNRRGFEERLEIELSRAQRERRPVSVIVGDLDHFKLVNDRHGHRAGDETLRRFAETALQVKRLTDDMGRIGGEEFALILPDTDEHGALLLAERIRRATRDRLETVTVSFGVATFPTHERTPDGVLHKADQALYLAKRLGRDRCVIYSDEAASLDHTDVRKPVEQTAAVLVLAETLDLRDSGTALHSQTVGRYCEQIAVHLGLDEQRTERIRLAGLLHDIGKIGVADEILRKPGGLTDSEWAEMRKHPELGARILTGANLDELAVWVLAHHERPDGRGYPSGLSAEEIPLESRILSVADAYEAMTSDRPYRDALPQEVALEELRRGSGTQFDPEIVEAFLTLLGASAVIGADV